MLSTRKAFFITLQQTYSDDDDDDNDDHVDETADDTKR
jgi:hypothetical protein